MDPSRLRALSAEAAPAAVELRRHLHRRPELAWHEIETTHRVARVLREFGLEPRLHPSGTGLTLQIGSSGPVVGFRADLDALPIQEQSDVPFASEIAGVMHACGHDAHTAIGTGIARVLSQIDDLPGRVRFVFQPAEEAIPGGASRLTAEGIADGLEAIVAFHVDPTLPAGQLGLRSGAVTGASDRVSITLSGPGGHTSRPHRTVDLVYVAAKVAVELPSILQRSTDPRHPVVLAFGRIVGGAADNVIPSQVELGGTVRLFDIDLWRTMEGTVDRHIQDLIHPFGAHAKMAYERGSPPVVNDRAVIATTATAIERVLGPDAATATHQSMGSEDFSWYLEHVPGAMIRLGVGLKDRLTDLHSSSFDLDEDGIETGILAGAATMIELMAAARR